MDDDPKPQMSPISKLRRSWTESWWFLATKLMLQDDCKWFWKRRTSPSGRTSSRFLFSMRVCIQYGLSFWHPDLNLVWILGHVFNFRRIDLQDVWTDSLRNFCGIKLYTYSLQENYTGTIRGTRKCIKLKVYKNFRKSLGNPDPPTWRSWPTPKSRVQN